MTTIYTHRQNQDPDSDADIRQWVNDRSQPDDLIIAPSLLMIDIFDTEQTYIVGYWEYWYQRLVKGYCALGDEENAKKWALRAAKLHRAYALSGEPWDAIAKNPRNTNWWGLRANAKSGVLLLKTPSCLSSSMSLKAIGAMVMENNFSIAEAIKRYYRTY